MKSIAQETRIMLAEKYFTQYIESYDDTDFLMLSAHIYVNNLKCEDIVEIENSDYKHKELLISYYSITH